MSGATFYDCINTIYQFIKPFLDNKLSSFFINMVFKASGYLAICFISRPWKAFNLESLEIKETKEESVTLNNYRKRSFIYFYRRKNNSSHVIQIISKRRPYFLVFWKKQNKLILLLSSSLAFSKLAIVANSEDIVYIIEALPGFLGNKGIMSFISGEQENTSLKIEGTGEQR